ncbi:MAG: thioredoxin [Verrucomicrobiota bacterium]|nr:thioredoxin [Verrucomicrobiota bacterium]
MPNETVVHITPNNWKSEVLKSPVPVLVDFYAEWCGPCKTIAPILDDVAADLAGKLKVAKVDVDKDRSLAAQFGIRSVPTLLVLKSGVVQEQMGPMNKAAFLKKLSAHLPV